MLASHKVFLFDLDNTLVNRDRAFRQVLTAHIASEASREELVALDGHGHGNRRVFFERWRRLCGSAPTQDEFTEMIAANVQPDGLLISALASLAKRASTGVITNGGPAQRVKLRAAGLDKVFPLDRVWVSTEVGLEKPDPKIFLMAAQAFSALPMECVYFGDKLDIDIVGAKSAGMEAVHVRRVISSSQVDALAKQEVAG